MIIPKYERARKDASGEYDYESIYALDLDLINEQFNALFRGKGVRVAELSISRAERVKRAATS